MVQDTKDHGVVGAITGTGGLFRHTMAGGLGVVTKMTRTFGDGVSTLTTDQQYL